MLQRSFFARKRHLEQTIARCKQLACKQILNFGRRSLSSQNTGQPPALSISSMPVVGTISDFQKSGNATKGLLNPLWPAEFFPVMDALESDLSQERILKFIEHSPGLSSFFSNRKKIREIVKELAQSPKPHYSLQVLNLAYHLGHTLNPSAYESVAFHLSQSKMWDVVIAVVASARQHIGHTTLRLLNWRALALMETRRYSLLQHIVHEFEVAEISPTRRTYHIILSGFMRNNDMEGAKRCLRTMRGAGFHMDTITHTLLGNLYRNFGTDPQVRQNALESLPNLPALARTTVVNRLIQASLDKHDLCNTARLLSLFDAESIEDILSVTKFEHASRDESQLTFNPTPGLALKPDSDTIAIFMNYMIRKSELEGAIRLASSTTSLRVPATPNLITSLIHTYFLQGHGNTAICLVSGLCIKPSFELFDSLSTGFDAGNKPPSLDLARISLTTRICNALLRGILNRQGLFFVPTVFAIMHANNVYPNSRTLEILLSYMNKINIPRPRTLFQVLRGFSSPTIRPSLKHMHHIISRIFHDERRMFICSAWNTRSTRRGPSRKRVHMLGTGVSFDPTGGVTLANYLSYRAAARPTVQSLSQHGVKSDSVMIFLRMRRHSVLHLDVESAHRILRTLMARGIHPNEYHFGALVEGYALSGNFSAAIEAIRTAERSGVKPNVVMYTSVIAAYARRHDADSAMRTFKEMIAAGIAPDVASIDAVVSAFHAIGAYTVARNLLTSLWTYVQPFPEALETANLKTMLSRFRSLNALPTRMKSTVTRRKAVYHQLKLVRNAYHRYFGFHSKPSEIRSN